MGSDFSVLEKITIYFIENKFSLGIKMLFMDHSSTILTVTESRAFNFPDGLFLLPCCCHCRVPGCEFIV
jgi:hypothetical protein